MTVYERLVDIISKFKIYDVESPVTKGELKACNTGFQLLRDYMDEMIRECFVQTATDYGLTIKEHYFDSIPRNNTIQERRDMLLNILSVDYNDFNLEGVKKFLNYYPISYTITEHHDSYLVVINIVKDTWIEENFDFMQETVNKFFPAHIRIQIYVK